MVQYSMTNPHTGEKMPGSSEFYFFDLVSFIKKEEEITNNQEKWLFLLRNSAELKAKPESFQGPEFNEFFVAAKIAGFNSEERKQYEIDMVTELDRKLSLEYAEQKGLAKGRAEGLAKAEQVRLATAKNFKASGVAADIIVKCTGLSEEEVQRL